MIKLKDILSEKYGTYTDNAQNKALKRVGKKYGSTGKTTPPKIDMSKVKIPKIKIPKFELPKLDSYVNHFFVILHFPPLSQKIGISKIVNYPYL